MIGSDCAPEGLRGKGDKGDTRAGCGCLSPEVLHGKQEPPWLTGGLLKLKGGPQKTWTASMQKSQLANSNPNLTLRLYPGMYLIPSQANTHSSSLNGRA